MKLRTDFDNGQITQASSLTRRHFLARAGLLTGGGIALAACGSTSSGTSSSGGHSKALVKTGGIAIQVNTLANIFYTNWLHGYNQAVPAINCTTHDLVYNGSASTQISQVDGLATAGIPMLIGDSATNGPIKAIAQQCQAKQIYYSNIWDIPPWVTPPSVGDYWVMFQIPDSITQGYDVAKTLFNHVGGKGTILWASGLPGAEPDILRTRGIKQALTEFPGINLVGGQPGNWNTADGYSVIKDLIVAHPNFVGVLCQNDSEALGALEALKQAGKAGTPVVGMDGIQQGMLAVANGTLLATHFMPPGYQAGWAAVNVFDALNGWKPTLPERMMSTASLLIDNRATALHYYNLMYKQAQMPFDWRKMSRILHPDDWDPQWAVTPISPFEFWKGTPVTGAESFPHDLYTHSVNGGEFAQVTKEYQQHWKMKF